MDHTESDEQTDSGVDTEGVDSSPDFSTHPMTQSKLFSLIQQVDSSTVEQVQALIASGEEDVTLRGVYDETYLHLLCTPTSEEQARYLPPLVYVLVGAGVDVNAQDKEGNTVLHVCAINESPSSLLKAFLRIGADPSIVNAFENTALDFADDLQHKAMLERYEPGLITAVQQGDEEKVKVMTEHWFNINIKHQGTKLSKVAKKAGHSTLCEWLSDRRKQNHLIHAVLSGDVDSVKNLLESKDLEVDIMDKSCLKEDGSQRMWPLVAEAIHTGLPQTASLLLKRVDVNQTVEVESGELQPLFVWALNSVTKPDSHFVKALLKKADFSLFTADQHQQLYTFWKQGFPSNVLEYFVNHGYDLMTRDQDGNTLRDRILLESYTQPPEDCKKQLLFVDKCLIKLIQDGATEKLYGYLLKGCDLNITDHKGKAALDIAKKAKQLDIVELLEKAPATLKTIHSLYKTIELGNLQGLRGQLNVRLAESRDPSGRTLLHTAVMFERTFIIQFLLRRHLEILHHKDMMGRSALHYACWLHLDDIEDRLVAAGADPALTDKLGKTPLDYKLDSKHEAEEERHRQYGVRARLLNAYLRASEAIRTDPRDSGVLVEQQLGGVAPGDLDELQQLCPDLAYRRLVFLCVEHKKEQSARALIMAGADMDVSEQVPGSGETSRVVTFLQAAEEANLQGLVSYCKKKMSAVETSRQWERAAQLSLARIGMEGRMTSSSSRGLTALSRHSWDSVMSPPHHRAKADVGQRSASVDTGSEAPRYRDGKQRDGSSSCVIL